MGFVTTLIRITLKRPLFIHIKQLKMAKKTKLLPGSEEALLTKDLVARIHPNIIAKFKLPFYRFCQVRMLIVTDGSADYTETTGFGLGKFLKAFQNPVPFTYFSIDKAHRQTEATATPGFDNFTFDKPGLDLTKYDVIWLFGVDRKGGFISAGELRKLSEYMNNGGGLFATGDHEDLGVDLCSRVPRVRNMRRWHYPLAGPLGEPVAPGASGNNHDTIADKDPATPGRQGDQSDEVPQNIRPKYYYGWTSPSILGYKKFPHPVLCGPRGVIKVMPDHMHEGLCEVPTDISRTFNFSGYSITEYPTVAGVQALPEVIAWGVNQNTNNEFGLISVYDGHREPNVGRVLTDATWHHFFNINLMGFEAALGASTTVKAQYEDIQAYFRNIGYWLAGKSKQNCFRNRGFWWIQHHYDVLIAYVPKLEGRNPLLYYRQLGVIARNALNDLASQCQSSGIFIELFPPIAFKDFIDPWKIKPGPDPGPDPFPGFDPEFITDVAIGAGLHELRTQTLAQKDLAEKDILKVVEKGVQAGMSLVVKDFKKSITSLEKALGC